MSQTDSAQTEVPQWEQLAGALFDDVIVPLALERSNQSSADYFPLGPDEQAKTYFVEPSLAAMQAADFQPHPGNADGLINAVAALWAAQGEDNLAQIVGPMSEIAALLALESVQTDENVDVLCYTLF